MRWTRRSNRKALRVLALALVTSAAITGTASAMVADGVAGTAALPYQSAQDGGPVFMNGTPDGYVGSGVDQLGGVTPTNLARAYVARQPEGVTPVSLARGYVQPGYGVQAMTASSDGPDSGDLALGFGLGLILATSAAIAVAISRRQRMAHS